MSLIVRDRSHQDPRAYLPCPFLHLRLFKESMPLRERAFFTLEQTFYPAASNTNSNNLLRKFKETLEIEGQLSSHKDEVQEIFHRCVQKVIAHYVDVISRAGVKSLPDFEAKFHLIRALKKQALALYFNNGGKEIKHQIDQALTATAMPRLQDKNATVAAYWNMLAQDPWGAERHDELQRDMLALLGQKFTDVTYLLESQQSPSFKANYGKNLYIHLSMGFQSLTQPWIAKREHTKYEPDQITLDYSVWIATLFYRPMMRKFHRATLTSLIAKTPIKIKELAEQKKANNTLLRNHYNRGLNSPTCCTDLEKLKKQWGTSISEEYLITIVEINTQHKKNCILKIKQYDAEDCLRWAEKQWGYNPQELREACNPEISHDNKVNELVSLFQSAYKEDASDLFLDLNSLADPVAYFVRRLKERDEKALALFNPRGLWI